MNKTEILEKSRKENKNMDEMEKTALAQAGQFGAGAGGIACISVIVANALFQNGSTVSFAVGAVYFSITGSTLLFKWAKLRRKHELVFGIIQLMLAVACYAMYIVSIVRG